jgi:FMN phosphatase YigB (HAD superfamily)
MHAPFAGLADPKTVELLCLDAGNTVIFLDHARLAKLAQCTGFAPTAQALIEAEGRAKLRAEFGTLEQVAVDDLAPGAPKKTIRSWACMVATILVEAGLPRQLANAHVNMLWPHHVARNLWSLVPDGLLPALSRFRRSGRRIALVSNSEGMLDRLFTELGIRSEFDVFLDSGIIGVEKPDPAIFARALREGGARADRALHLGDVYATDIVGARAAGVHCALIDPFGHYANRHLEVPRVESVVAALDAILAAPNGPES